MNEDKAITPANAAGITPEEAKSKLLLLLRSRKFWALIATITIAIFGNRAGMDEQALLGAIGGLIAYILGTGLEDARRTG